jgi:hypothetical protein
MATFGTNQRLELVTLNRTTPRPPEFTLDDILTVPSGSNFFIFINRLYADTTNTFSLGIRYKNVPAGTGVSNPHSITNYNWQGSINNDGTLRMDYNQNPDFVGNSNFTPVPMEYGDRLLYPEDKLYCHNTTGAGNNILVIEYTKVFYGGQDIEV